MDVDKMKHETRKWIKWCIRNCPNVYNAGTYCNYCTEENHYSAAFFYAVHMAPEVGWEHWPTTQDAEYFSLWVNRVLGILVLLEAKEVVVTFPRDSDAFRKLLEEQEAYFYPVYGPQGRLPRLQATDIKGSQKLPWGEQE